MKKSIDYSESPNLEDCAPRISIIVPYDRKTNKQEMLFNNLSLEADRIEKELIRSYSEEEASPVINKLRHLIQGISPCKEGESMGIFVSPAKRNHQLNTEGSFSSRGAWTHKYLQLGRNLHTPRD